MRLLLQLEFRNLFSSLRNELAKNDLAEEINILETGPLGFFGRGICLTVYPENINYEDVRSKIFQNLFRNIS
jgi:NADH-quinone oxidoreductase subunit F